jgi:hypothetical protein
MAGVFWAMCFHQHLPSSSRIATSSKPAVSVVAGGNAAYSDSKSSGKDSAPVDAAWNGDGGLPDAAAQAFVRLAYRYFRLFYGDMATLVSQGGVAMLRQKLSRFLRGYVESLKADDLALTLTLDGFRYFSIDQGSYLLLQSFVHLMCEAFPPIRHCVVCFGHFLLFSTLPSLQDTGALHHYLTQRVAPFLSKDKMNGGDLGGVSRDVFGPVVNVFVLPLDLKEDVAARAVPAIPCIRLGPSCEVFHLVIFKCNRMLWAWAVSEAIALTTSFLTELAKNLDRVQKFESVFSELESRASSSPESSPKFLYYNSMNKACKNTLVSQSASSKDSALSKSNDFNQVIRLPCTSHVTHPTSPCSCFQPCMLIFICHVGHREVRRVLHTSSFAICRHVCSF